MTFGDVPANHYGYYVNIYASGSIEVERDIMIQTLGQKKISTYEKLIEFVESFGNGDYDKGFRYIKKMLTNCLN